MALKYNLYTSPMIFIEFYFDKEFVLCYFTNTHVQRIKIIFVGSKPTSISTVDLLLVEG